MKEITFFLFFLIPERKGRGSRERDRHRGTHQYERHINQLPPECALTRGETCSLGTEPAIFQFTGRCSSQLSHTGQGEINFFLPLSVKTVFYINRLWPCPDQCGSVGWELFCRAKGHGFDSLSRYMLGLQVQFPVWVVQGATNRCFSSSFSPSLPLSLKINKIL